jgi:hypothetical protein
MNHLRLTALPLLGIAGALAFASSGAGELRAEENLWPVRVAQTDPAGNVTSWQAVGPLLYRKPAADGGTVGGVRPLYAQWTNPDGSQRETNVLYPLFTYRTDGETYRWSVLQLVNRSGDRAAREAALPPAMRYRTFDLWPVWFSRHTGEPGSSYSALFPVAGEIKSRFGYDRLSFVAFPLYGRAERRGAVTTATPWPFIKTTRGSESGFALWPLFGWREQPERFDHRFWLWPLGWSNTDAPALDAPPGAAPARSVGFLPFYSRDSAPGFTNTSFLWPFFGYTDRTAPNRYHETRYFWPLLVQGRGDGREVFRFAPLYTHSLNKGVSKTWVVWPLYREKRWDDLKVSQTQRQLFYFIYRSTTQRSRTNPAAEPAEKTTVWPLFSEWDNGAGRVQFQFPSLLEVFFPDNERIRASWSPLFALYRYDQQAPGYLHHEWLWGLVSSRRTPREHEFHLGPLFSSQQGDAGRRVALGNGLVAWQRGAADGRWRFSWFDFLVKAPKLGAAPR